MSFVSCGNAIVRLCDHSDVVHSEGLKWRPVCGDCRTVTTGPRIHYMNWSSESPGLIPYTPALNRHYNGHIKALFSHGGSSVTQEAGAMVQGQKWDGCVIRTSCCGDMCTEQRGYIYELTLYIRNVLQAIYLTEE
jgi:hypothetical protein